MRLGEALDESTILLGLSGLDKWQVIERLTDAMLASERGDPAWRDVVLRGLVDRERQSSTGMQDGFAIPHCRLDDPIQHTLVALAVVPEGMEFQAIDGQPTRLVVGLVTPRKQNQQHLRVLADIARLFANAAFREALLRCRTPAEVLEVIRAQEEELGQ